MMWNGYFGHGAGWEGWLMFMFMIVFAVSAIVAVVYFVRYFAQPQAAPAQIAQPQAVQFVAPSAVSPAAAESPQDILKRRYAAGEIEHEEYLQKLGDL